MNKNKKRRCNEMQSIRTVLVNDYRQYFIREITWRSSDLL